MATYNKVTVRIVDNDFTNKSVLVESRGHSPAEEDYYASLYSDGVKSIYNIASDLYNFWRSEYFNNEDETDYLSLVYGGSNAVSIVAKNESIYFETYDDDENVEYELSTIDVDDDGNDTPVLVDFEIKKIDNNNNGEDVKYELVLDNVDYTENTYTIVYGDGNTKSISSSDDEWFTTNRKPEDSTTEFHVSNSNRKNFLYVEDFEIDDIIVSGYTVSATTVITPVDIYNNQAVIIEYKLDNGDWLHESDVYGTIPRYSYRIYENVSIGSHTLHIRDQFGKEYSQTFNVESIDNDYDLDFKLRGKYSPFNVKLYKSSDLDDVINEVSFDNSGTTQSFSTFEDETEYTLIATDNIGNIDKYANIYTGSTYSITFENDPIDGNYLILEDGDEPEIITNSVTKKYRPYKEIEITAVPYDILKYSFVDWSDGTTDNPKSHEVTNDLTLSANYTRESKVVKLFENDDVETYRFKFNGGGFSNDSSGELTGGKTGDYLTIIPKLDDNSSNYLHGLLSSNDNMYKSPFNNSNDNNSSHGINKRDMKQYYLNEVDLHLSGVTKTTSLNQPNFLISVDILGTMSVILHNGYEVSPFITFMSNNDYCIKVYDIDVGDVISVVMNVDKSIKKFPSNTWYGNNIINGYVNTTKKIESYWYLDNDEQFLRISFHVTQDHINNVNNVLEIKAE